MEFLPVLDLVASYTGNQRYLRLVSKDWNATLMYNSMLILEGIRRKYPNRSITSAILEATKLDDVDTMKKIAFEFTGILMFRWNLGYDFISSRSMFQIYWMKGPITNTLKKCAYKFASDDILRSFLDKVLAHFYCRVPIDKYSILHPEIINNVSLQDVLFLVPLLNLEERNRFILNLHLSKTSRIDIAEWIERTYGLQALDIRVKKAKSWIAIFLADRGLTTYSVFLNILLDKEGFLFDDPIFCWYPMYMKLPHIYQANKLKINIYILSNIFNCSLQYYILDDILGNNMLLRRYIYETISYIDLDRIAYLIHKTVGTPINSNNLMNLINEFELVEALDISLTSENYTDLISRINKPLNPRMKFYLLNGE